MDDLTNLLRNAGETTTGWKDGEYVQPPVRSRRQPAVLLWLSRCVLAYREEKFEVSMLLLKHVDGLEVAKEALVIP